MIPTFTFIAVVLLGTAAVGTLLVLLCEARAAARRAEGRYRAEYESTTRLFRDVRALEVELATARQEAAEQEAVHKRLGARYLRAQQQLAALRREGCCGRCREE